VLPGREREGAFLNELLNRVRAGHSAAVMVHGEAGVGKTALLNEAFGSVSDLRVVRAAGVESEMELPFAGLQQLCVSMLGHLEHLPLPGGRLGPPSADRGRPDRFLIGLAVLSLLSRRRAAAAGLRVDDCQWLDQASAQALAFAARRIQAEGVLLPAAREPGQDFDGIPGFMVGDCAISMPGRCCARSCHGRSTSRSGADTGRNQGNPLALLELPRGASRRAGGGSACRMSPLAAGSGEPCAGWRAAGGDVAHGAAAAAEP
jgi:hypothetical protein